MGNVPSFITPEEYSQLHEETGCERERERGGGDPSRSDTHSAVTESQIRRLYSRFAHLDKRSKGYLA